MVNSEDDDGGVTSTDFTVRQRLWLRKKFGIHASGTHTSGGNKDWGSAERTAILALFGINDGASAPAARDLTDAQRSAVLRQIGIPKCNTLTTATGRDYTDKQRNHFLRLYGGPVR